MKAQTGRGRIKKLARELRQNQGMISEAQVPLIGLKRPRTQFFSEQDSKVYKKKKCSGLSVSPSNVDISTAAAVQRRQEP